MSTQTLGIPKPGDRPILRILPRGLSLPEAAWMARHRAILLLLWAHSVAIPVFAGVRDFGLPHLVLESLVVPATAVVAAWPTLSRRTRTVAASMGLLSSSAILVHLSGGVIEMHFHFFVMVAVVALYQDWIPFLAAIAYVFVHHGIVGALAPESVFNHPAALNHPWRWAGIHALFIAGISAACLVTWRLNELTLSQQQDAENRLRQEGHIAETLHEFGSALAAELDLDRVVQMVTDAATERTHAAFGAFFYNVADDQGESFLLFALSGAPIEAFERFGLPRNTAIFQPTFEGTGVVRSDDITEDPRYGQMAPHFGMPAGHLPVRSYLAVPVRARDGSVLGGLFFGHPERGRFDEIDERIVVGIAAQAAIAFDNARLYESEREARVISESSRRRLSLLVEASRVLTGSLELETIIRGLSGLVAGSMADYCVIDLCEPEARMRRIAAGNTPARQELAASLETLAPETDGTSATARALRTRTAELLDPAPSDLFGLDAARGLFEAPGSAIVTPLIGRHDMLGVLTVARAAGSDALSSDDLLIAEELARRAGFAVENAQLYARQRTVAETLQHSLLPERLPDIPGIESASRYRAGGPGVDVGGDWYDLLALGGGRVVVAMGDVVGRGERAAALMGQLRTAARVYALQDQSPGQIIGHLNDLLHDLGPGDMATMICAELHAESCELVVASAGHPPPILITAEGRAEFGDCENGPPIGAVPRVTYEDCVIAFEPGATLVLYTDGLVEERSEPIDTGLERLRGAVDEHTGDLEELCDRALGALPDDCHDDVALLAVRVSPLTDRFRLRLPTRPSTLQPLRATLRRWLETAGATQEETYEILVAAIEACANAIRHTRWSESSYYDFEASIDDGIRIQVRDAGTWRPPRDDGGGRGLRLIESFMDHLSVEKSSTGTTVTMSRRLANRSREDVTA